MEIALVLGFPLLGGLLLALVGHKRWAPEVKALMSLTTLVAAAALTRRVITDGPMTALEEQFFVDPFNVFLVALTALSLIHISEPTRLGMISYAVFCLKKKTY